MTDDGGAASLLADRPDLADDLEAVVAVDEETAEWTFDDVPVESGAFGEFVARGIVEQSGDGYRLADPAAARTALDGDGAVDESRRPWLDHDVRWRVGFEVDRLSSVLLAAALLVVALVRSHPFPSVYRNGDVVLSGNDPYYYRYWVERTMAESSTVFDLDALATLPSAIRHGEPLMVATLWWLSELLGGGPNIVGHVLAWYPVASAVVTAVVVYLIAVRIARDRRVGLAALLFFAILPGHAMRTSLGFADHHAFDYPWLAATALLLVVLATIDREGLRRPRTWLASVGLGVAIAGQVLSWEGGALLVAPIGVVVATRALVDVHRGDSPLIAGAPVVAGLAVATAISGTVHLVVGWHSPQVGFTPALLLVGSLGALALATVVRRTSGDVRHLAVVDAFVAILGVLMFRFAVPAFWDAFAVRIGRLFRSDGIAETFGLFSIKSFGFLFLFGFTLVLALPTMVWAIQRARDDGRWLVGAVYAWYFLVLATLQVRFVGEMAPFAAVFAGFGFVWVAAWVDATEPIDWARETISPMRLPERSSIGPLLALFVLFASLGVVQVPVKTSQVVIDDDTYHSADFIAERSATLGQGYPANYVLSRWGRNRVYNYFVNGESVTYSYARNNYRVFLRSSDPDGWYGEFEGQVGYVVVENGEPEPGARTTWARLAGAYGSRSGNVPGVGHYRALYVAPGGSKLVFAVVPGATLTGTTTPNASVAVKTNAAIRGASFPYERVATANETGAFEVTVAQPGTYTVETAARTVETDVTERAVREGTNVTVAAGS